ncbi:hypothetical protein SPI_06605 [Niveomyces insectorum RCEF 264]|uniref:Uncharacterized protein n=1 Tax=Niveomyces insectorum RCEF 264 TaxID=1081102 RepID=A0A167RF52_9HYPO|nr:hypothetical protein SPI_06605 [Niveomyces insectorum RCEF 264]
MKCEDAEKRVGLPSEKKKTGIDPHGGDPAAAAAAAARREFALVAQNALHEVGPRPRTDKDHNNNDQNIISDRTAFPV